MEPETKIFSLRTILSVTTGRLLTEGKGGNDNGIGDMYELLEWMTGEAPFTHSLGRFAEECKPSLYRQLSFLGRFNGALPKLDKWLEKSPTCPQEGVKMWLAEMKMMFPEIKDEYPVKKIDPNEHTSINPIQELSEMLSANND